MCAALFANAHTTVTLTSMEQSNEVLYIIEVNISITFWNYAFFFRCSSFHVFCFPLALWSTDITKKCTIYCLWIIMKKREKKNIDIQNGSTEINKQNSQSFHCSHGQLYCFFFSFSLFPLFLTSRALIFKQMTILSLVQSDATVAVFILVLVYNSMGTFLHYFSALSTTYLPFDSPIRSSIQNEKHKWHRIRHKKMPYMAAVCLPFNLFGIL